MSNEKMMTKQAYHLEEWLLKKPNISSFHYCIILPPIGGMSDAN